MFSPCWKGYRLKNPWQRGLIGRGCCLPARKFDYTLKKNPLCKRERKGREHFLPARKFDYTLQKPLVEWGVIGREDFLSAKKFDYTLKKTLFDGMITG